MSENKQKHGDPVEQLVQSAVAKAFEELSKSIAELPDKIREYAASDEATSTIDQTTPGGEGGGYGPVHGAYGAPGGPVAHGTPGAGKKPKVIRVPAGTLSKEGGHVYQVGGGQGKQEGSIPLLDDQTYLERAESPWQGGIVKVRGKNVKGAYQTMANLVQGSNFVRNFLSNMPQPTGKKIV